MHYNALDLSVDVSQDETTPAESDDNSSDYFADAETSSCGSFEHDDVFTSNPEEKDAAEKGLTAQLFICFTVTFAFHQSLIASFGLH